MDRLAERMRLRIARTFVGREAELALFAHSVASDPPESPVILVHGPGGIGKTCFLERAGRWRPPRASTPAASMRATSN